MKERLDGPVNDGINEPCRSCASACCGPKINIVLSDKERDFLRSAGTILSPIVRFSDNSTDMTLYSLESKCGFVDVKDSHKCRAHDDQQRPAVCAGFKAGGEICKQIKESRKEGVGYEFGY